MVIRSPKRSNNALRERRRWFSYYAGYTQGFVDDVLNQLELPSDASVLDPWNGTGTTTQVLVDRGITALGFDINPVPVVVAKARILDASVKGRLPGLSDAILARAAQSRFNSCRASADPLEAWLTPDSAADFRNIEYAIQELLVDAPEYQEIFKSQSVKALSRLACYFYVALFGTLRKFLNHFRASNPTWVKAPRTEGERIAIRLEQIHQAYKAKVNEMAEVLGETPAKVWLSKPRRYRIEVASSLSVPVDSSSANAVISSPPYCTRIDYAMATRPELALIGCSASDFKKLRDRMIGTPTINSKSGALGGIQNSMWGETCNKFLEAVANHTSKASQSYYLKYFIQYFNCIYRSLTEINRTLKQKGKCVLVVQDSYYKDIHNNLPTIFAEMGNNLGWVLSHNICFPVKQTLAGINKGTHKYRSTFTATESVLFFAKES